MAVSVKISEITDEKVSRLMAEMDLKRPDVLKIALSKGIFHSDKELPEIRDDKKGREIPLTTICPSDHLVIIKHTLIQKLNKNLLNDYDLRKQIEKSLNYGIDIMFQEVNSLSDVDNYLLFLVNNLGNKDTVTSVNHTKKIIDLLGI